MLTLDRLLLVEIHRNQLHIRQLGVTAAGLHHLGQILEHAAVAGQAGRQLQDPLERLALAAANVDDERAVRVLVRLGRGPAQVVDAQRRHELLYNRHAQHDDLELLGRVVVHLPDGRAEAALRKGEHRLPAVRGLTAEAELVEVLGHGEEGGEVVVESTMVSVYHLGLFSLCRVEWSRLTPSVT